jgi:hypothetical protein
MDKLLEAMEGKRMYEDRMLEAIEGKENLGR